MCVLVIENTLRLWEGPGQDNLALISGGAILVSSHQDFHNLRSCMWYVYPLNFNFFVYTLCLFYLIDTCTCIC